MRLLETAQCPPGLTMGVIRTEQSPNGYATFNPFSFSNLYLRGCQSRTTLGQLVSYRNRPLRGAGCRRGDAYMPRTCRLVVPQCLCMDCRVPSRPQMPHATLNSSSTPPDQWPPCPTHEATKCEGDCSSCGRSRDRHRRLQATSAATTRCRCAARLTLAAAQWCWPTAMMCGAAATRK